MVAEFLAVVDLSLWNLVGACLGVGTPAAVTAVGYFFSCQPGIPSSRISMFRYPFSYSTSLAPRASACGPQAAKARSIARRSPAAKMKG